MYVAHLVDRVAHNLYPFGLHPQGNLGICCSYQRPGANIVMSALPPAGKISRSVLKLIQALPSEDV